MTYAVNLVPAYGRDYASPEKVLEHWSEGKDFRIADIGMGRDDGRYTSVEDWNGQSVRIRFNRLADFVIIDTDVDGRGFITGTSTTGDDIGDGNGAPSIDDVI